MSASTTTTRPAGARPSTGWRRIGGVAAVIEALTFVVGIALFATVLADYVAEDATPADSVAFLVDHQGVLHLWHIVTLIVFAIALVPLTLSLRDRLAGAEPVLARASAAFGLIWAGLVLATGMVANVGVGAVADLAATDPLQAESLWSAVDVVINGLGGGNEVAGGIWVLLVSVAALRAGELSVGVNRLGAVSGLAGLVTVVPGLEEVGLVFGLGLIVWFAWVGAILLRRPHATR